MAVTLNRMLEKTSEGKMHTEGIAMLLGILNILEHDLGGTCLEAILTILIMVVVYLLHE